MAKKYRITLTAEEREVLGRMIARGKAAARKLAHARILLQADEGGPARADEDLAAALNVSVRTIERVRRRFVEQGLEAALLPTPAKRIYARKLDGEREAHLIALACSAPPEGKGRWTLRLLAEQDGGTSVCGCPVPRDGAPGAQKNELKPHLRRMWCIPPKQSAEFVYHMEEVLEVYCRPYDPKRPVVCLDETFRQLVGEVREPLPPAPGRVERYDCMYVRNGTASLFLAFEPLAGWRNVAVTDSRKRGDWARFVKALVEERYRDAEQVIRVMDQLNTHSPASLYEAFPPAEAKRLADRLEIHHTPKHGSWLNMAEIEFSALGRDLPERVADRSAMERRLAAWPQRPNSATVKADWHFTTANARIKLRKLYPSVNT